MDMGEKELRKRLLDFDRAVELHYPGRSFSVVFVGGGAMVLLGCLARATSDLDALHFPTELVSLMEQYDLSTRVTAYLHDFAYSHEERLVPVDLPTASVHYYTASLEDLVASKLHSPRPQDEQDVRRPEVVAALDWDRLHDVVQDMEGSRLNDHRHRQFLYNYEEYRKECGPCVD